MSSVFDDLVGQPDAVATLSVAARAAMAAPCENPQRTRWRGAGIVPSTFFTYATVSSMASSRSCFVIQLATTAPLRV